MTERTIHLRRPPTIHIDDGPFVPPHANLCEVESRWNRLCASNPAYFDGRIWHVLGVQRNGYGGAVVHVVECAYRFYAVQDDEFDLGVRSLGVKGILQDNSQRVLVGQRTDSVAQCKGMWEFAPSGGVDPGQSPGEALRAELMEETGLITEGEPIPIALLYDPCCLTWEVVCRLRAKGGPLRPNPHEYKRLEWRQAGELPSGLSPIAKRLVSLL